jgi:Hemerythrin HHE cation binding domain
VSEGEKNRLIAWNRELAAAHERLRRALRVTRNALDRGDAESAGPDLLLFSHALTASATADELAHHLDGLGAIMESHFNYEERQLLAVLSTLDVEADPNALLGPL